MTKKTADLIKKIFDKKGNLRDEYYTEVTEDIVGDIARGRNPRRLYGNYKVVNNIIMGNPNYCDICDLIGLPYVKGHDSNYEGVQGDYIDVIIDENNEAVKYIRKNAKHIVEKQIGKFIPVNRENAEITYYNLVGKLYFAS